MLLLRLLAILAALMIAVSMGLWLLTGNRRYYLWAMKTGKLAFMVALLIIGLLLAERLIVL